VLLAVYPYTHQKRSPSCKVNFVNWSFKNINTA
jgi:hypothetical protein